MMLRLTPAVLAVFVLAVLVAGVAAQPAAAVEKMVTVHVKCRAKPIKKDDTKKEYGPTSVTVDPWLLWIHERDEIKWKLKIDESDDNWIIVEAKDGQPWPYKLRKHEGNVTEDAHAKDWEGGGGSEYEYNIKVSCNAYEFVIDPRVRVGP